MQDFNKKTANSRVLTLGFEIKMSKSNSKKNKSDLKRIKDYINMLK